MNKTIDTETLLLKVESHEHRIGIMENLLRDAKQVLTLEEAALFMGISKSSLYRHTSMNFRSFVPTARLYTLKSPSF